MNASAKHPAPIRFDDPRLTMSAAGRFLFRVSGSAAYGLLGAGAIVFSLSDSASLQGVGWLAALFLLERAVHAGMPDKSLTRLKKDESVNAARYFAPQTLRALESSFDRARFLKAHLSLVLLEELLKRKDVETSFLRMDVSVSDLLKKIRETPGLNEAEHTREKLREEAEQLSVAAFQSAVKSGSDAVLPRHLVGALGEIKDPAFLRLLTLFNIDPADLSLAIFFGETKRARRRLRGRNHSPAHFMSRKAGIRERVMNRAWTARPTPELDRFSEDLTLLGSDSIVGLLVGHEREYEAMVDALSRSGNPNALLIGEHGVGKEAIIERLAFQIAKDRVPPPLFDRRLVSLSLGRLAAGADAAEIGLRIRTIVDEISRAGNIILYIPNIHDLVKSGSALSLSVADVLLPAMKGAGFSVIGTTEPRDFKIHLEPSGDIPASFQSIRVDELSENDAIRLLIYWALLKEEGIPVSFRAIQRAVRLAHQYIRQKLLPGSAEDVLMEAIAHAKEAGHSRVGEEDVVSVLERQVNVPLRKADADESKKLLNLEALIHERLIDQEEAVSAVARAMREYRSGLSRKTGPIAAFLFVGPTGVGKTELAKILSRIQFGGEENMLRFDMSEYQTRESIARFIGSPDGAVSGGLTEAVREKPYSLLLLDEFEKAHPDLLNLFLQVFDDGRLTDALGRTVDFKNTIIVATSNAHSSFIKEEIERGAAVVAIADTLTKKLTDYFRAELLNRFSGIIVFKPLSPADIAQITRIQMHELTKAVASSHGIELVFSERATEKIAELGFDPVFGARPLRKVISEKLKGPLAEQILKGEFARGSRVTVDMEGDSFHFSHV